MKTVRLSSGVKGWQGKLHENYVSFQEFFEYDKMYGLAKRLGFSSAVTAWNHNPVIQGGVNPSDFKLVSDGHTYVTGMKGEFICPECGGNKITGTGNISWSVKKQKWEVDSVMDKGDYCGDCDGETRAEFVILKGAKVSKLPVVSI